MSCFWAQYIPRFWNDILTSRQNHSIKEADCSVYIDINIAWPVALCNTKYYQCSFFLSYPAITNDLVTFKLVTFTHFSFNKFACAFQNSWIIGHSQNIWNILAQKRHRSVFNTPISFNITLVPRHLWMILSWNHLRLTSESLLRNKNHFFQSISMFSFSFHFAHPLTWKSLAISVS